MLLNKNLDKNKWFQDRLDEIYGNEFKLLSNYINTKTNVEVLHLKCGSIICKKPIHLMQGYGCKKCSNREIMDNKKFDSILGSEYTRLGNCKGNKNKVLIRHNCKDCNFYEYEVKPSNFQQGKRCPKCSGVLKKNEQDVQNFLDANYPNQYKVIGKYINKDTPIEIIHIPCNNKIYPTWNNIRNKRFSCKYCKMTSGELEVALILDSMNINFEYQYTFKDCKDKQLLPFDFYFVLNNIKYIIEYDGRQHFMEIFGEEENKKSIFETTKIHDSIKNNYCNNNGIKLLRIKYDTENIKQQIIDFIEK